MKNFIYIQYKLYKSGGKSVGIEKIRKLAEIYLTEEERAELFKDEEE